jgi:hypothetical protein
MNKIVIAFLFANFLSFVFLIYSIHNQINIPPSTKRNSEYRDYSLFSLVFAILIFLLLTYNTFIFYNLAKTVKETETFVKSTLLKTASEVLKSSKK